MRPSNAFDLDTRNVERTARSALLYDGRRIGRVRGSCIDAQFACRDWGYLILVSYNHPFSALESAYFVDSAGRVSDSLTFGHEMAQGLISDIALDGTDVVSFAFPMNERCRIRIARQQTWFGLGVKWLHLD